MKSNRLESIADDMLLFFPLFRMLMKGECRRSHKKPSHQAYALLGILMHHEAMPMSEIGRLLCISKPNVTSLVDKLIKENKVERLYDAKDGRIINIRVTAKGKRFLLGERKTVKENIKRNLSGLCSKDLDTLCRSLEHIKVTVSKIREVERHGR